jgi:hypothetical protein
MINTEFFKINLTPATIFIGGSSVVVRIYGGIRNIDDIREKEKVGG